MASCNMHNAASLCNFIEIFQEKLQLCENNLSDLNRQEVQRFVQHVILDILV